MVWLWIAVSVISGSVGDLLSAYGMARYGAIERFDATGMGRVIRYIGSHPAIVIGIASNAISFISFIALLSLTSLSYAIPVTGLGYVLRTVLAKIFLGEYISAKRWAGVILVSIGVVLISI